MAAWKRGSIYDRARVSKKVRFADFPVLFQTALAAVRAGPVLRPGDFSHRPGVSRRLPLVLVRAPSPKRLPRVFCCDGRRPGRLCGSGGFNVCDLLLGSYLRNSRRGRHPARPLSPYAGTQL